MHGICLWGFKNIYGSFVKKAKSHNIFEHLIKCNSSFRTCLTHVANDGKVKMVDVNAKVDSKRIAMASCTVKLGKNVFEAVHKNTVKKGDVLIVAKIAGIMGAKNTPHLIPLCHSISASNINLVLNLDDENYSVRIHAEVSCVGKTGVEMEALTAVSIAGLTVYDMCKSMSHDIVIERIHLEAKSGGKQDYVRK